LPEILEFNDGGTASVLYRQKLIAVRTKNRVAARSFLNQLGYHTALDWDLQNPVMAIVCAYDPARVFTDDYPPPDDRDFVVHKT